MWSFPVRNPKTKNFHTKTYSKNTEILFILIKRLEKYSKTNLKIQNLENIQNSENFKNKPAIEIFKEKYQQIIYAFSLKNLNSNSLFVPIKKILSKPEKIETMGQCIHRYKERWL